jgi:prepilin-type N-terminal cleavage/methylation domain-containing protein
MFLSSPRRRGFTLIEILITISIMAILLAIAVPNWIQSRTRTNARACMKQLQMIRSAKENYAMTRNLGASAAITMADLVSDGWLRPGMTCPNGYTYTVGAMNEDPTCPSALAGHVVDE